MSQARNQFRVESNVTTSWYACEHCEVGGINAPNQPNQGVASLCGMDLQADHLSDMKNKFFVPFLTMLFVQWNLGEQETQRTNEKDT